MTSKLAERRTSIFERISGLAREHGAVNLGQGFPDFGWPEDVVEKAAEALRTGSNQYPPMRGLPVLREAVAEHYGRHQGLAVAPDAVTVTSGATRSEEHTSELQSLMRISCAVFCLTKKD